MKLTIIILLITTTISCKVVRNNDLNEVWYNIDTSAIEKYYTELHFNDSSVTIISNVGIEYYSDYSIIGDTLKQNVKDSYNLDVTVDTLNFLIERISVDKIKLINALNKDAFSVWDRLPVKSYDFNGEKGFNNFIEDFKERYKNNYVKKYQPEKIKEYLKYFEENWETKI